MFSISMLQKYIPALCLTALLLPTQLRAEGPPRPSEIEHPVAIVLLVVIVGLLIAIGVLANVVLGASQVFREKMEKLKKAAQATTILFLLFMAVPAFAQEETAQPAAVPFQAVEGLSNFSFFTMMSIIALELIIIVALLFNLRFLLGLQKVKTPVAEAEKKQGPSWFEKWNGFVSKEKEASIDLGHDYDGIRELDNRLPPWWLYGFYLTIIFGVIYLWRFHVSETAPSSAEEFRIAMENAEREQEEYLKKAANRVDESNVEMISDAAQLTAGKNVFIASCVACHGKAGEGGVGPNLTDAYWLHGGSVKDIFKTIKYGVPEKGMKAWKDDFSPSQIAQLASYIRTLKGTNPAGAKEKQGDLFEE
ncbi:cbb3-type cytochrome c oxidase N-terminal domain-containing protein [Parasegetibacter sp. NRK P23]|uniref:cbb3-type cytochrome c oxidase N-terminal domain-containing protein n=1 Tax=Parasegetibacter sp. NRK P23 TaxID=2942999 RepID=UPI0020448406|nr:cbb3-type cytochrome c oxidase N-terminal domain-containing protein [Parasegetibacter sp. NRK P23]MCM5529517.1 c-type cytochrome [Parasegetibacter sp. NRK P23]